MQRKFSVENTQKLSTPRAIERDLIFFIKLKEIVMYSVKFFTYLKTIIIQTHCLILKKIIKFDCVDKLFTKLTICLNIKARYFKI